MRAIPIFFLVLFNMSLAFAEIGVISVEEANKLISNPKPSERPLVLDTRGGYKDYIRGHLQSAHHLNFDTLRGTDEKGVPVQYLPEDLTRPLLVRAGVHKDRLHLLYAEGGTGDEILSASMVAYVLEKYGIKNVKIVDGGLPEYKSKFPLTQDYPHTPKGLLPKQTNFSIGVDVKTVLQKKDRTDVVLLDARPVDEYQGLDEIWPRKGHIPGARSYPWRNIMTETNTHKFKDAKEVLASLAAVGVDGKKEVIVYCGTSREGSLLRFYLSHVLGFPKVQLYEGSWKEYASLKQYPAETEAPKKLSSN